ncbi:calcium-binding protein [Inquilinus sp. CA228]|uniref:calcium-binding protein n=1 Tax=Inquilinus sp. CA228 TaxID=3455609 RepID=UPI003F8D3720
MRETKILTADLADLLYGGADGERQSGLPNPLDPSAGFGGCARPGHVVGTRCKAASDGSSSNNRIDPDEKMRGLGEQHGTDENDDILGRFGDDAIWGNGGEDKLDGGVGDDTLYGGTGNDRLNGGSGHDVLFGEADDDRLLGGEGRDELYGGDGDDVLYADYDGGAVSDDADLLSGGDGSDELHGSYGDNELYGDGGDDVIEGLDGNDHGEGGTGNDKLYGGNGDDQLFGDNGQDELDGGDGADRLEGGNGDDVLIGGAGADLLDGGSDVDTVSYAGSNAGVTVDLLGGQCSGGWAEGDVLIGIENVVGSKYDDIFFASSAANRFDGGEGWDQVDYSLSSSGVTVDLLGGQCSGGWADFDVLIGIECVIGSTYDDVFIASSAVTRFEGGEGADTVSYAHSTGGVQVDLGRYNLGYGGWAEGDVLIGIENVIGSKYDDVFIAGSAANRFEGGEGVDRVDYSLSGAGVTVDLGSGRCSGGWAEGDALEGIETVYGSAYADRLTGDGAANMLWGDEGADQLAGGGGDDALTGGAGQDVLSGGAGADCFTYELVSDSAAGSGDRIVDFSQEEGDKIDLHSFALDPGNGQNDELSFIDRGEFSNTAGELRYEHRGGDTVIQLDADGNGQADFEIVLAGTFELTADDFVL